MVVPRFRDDPVVGVLRWIMVAVMLAGSVLALTGQPAAFWQHHDLAVRHDGLSVHQTINHTFDFFLARGPAPFIACVAAYIVTAFILVSVLPRNLALVFMFAALLSHAFTGTNWLSLRWHFGGMASAVYAVGVGLPLAFILTRTPDPATVARRMALVTAAALLIDMALTLLGQPASFWSHPETTPEGNAVSRFFLLHGWESFALYAVAYAYVLYRAVGLLPRLAGLIVACAYLLVSFYGAGSRLFFVWHLGMPAVIAYGALLGFAIVTLTLRRSANPIGGAPGPQALRRVELAPSLSASGRCAPPVKPELS
ncbi:MAG TPA: hypothetical protein VGL42_02525 [Opitutaceae bacterium]|jgi:hypothetical protein